MANKETVNEIISMIMQGFKESDILKALKEEGVSYADIKDAIDQAQTKIELARAAGDESLLYEEKPKKEKQTQEQSKPKMTKSIISQPRPPSPNYREETGEEPQVQEQEQEAIPAPGRGFSQQQYYPQETSYPSQQVSYQSQEPDVSELDEMVEEIVNDKINEIETKIGSLDTFKQEIGKQIKAIDTSLDKFESRIKEKDTETMEKIQEFILELKVMNAEVIALENAFLKILSPLVSNMKDIDKIAKQAQSLDFKKAKDMDKLTEAVEIQKKKREEKSKSGKDDKTTLDKMIK